MFHDFDKAITVEQEHVAGINQWVKQFVRVVPVELEDDKLGIDCYWERGAKLLPVQYKIDIRSQDTGNYFIEYETLTQYGTSSYGWLQKLAGNILLVLYTPPNLLVTLQPDTLRTFVNDTRGEYRSVTVHSNNWSVKGYVIPCKTIHKLATNIWKMN